MIILENKKIGETPLETIIRLKYNHNISFDHKATYAGRLDPMAEGMLIILSSLDRYDKEKYNNLDKEYEFEILQNVHTDSLDILGLINKYNKNKKYINYQEIIKYIKQLSPEYIQKYPQYSSKTYTKVPLYILSKTNIYPKVKHKVQIKNIEYINKKHKNKIEIEKEIIEKINKVNGDFRQKEILKKWRKILQEFDPDFDFIIYKFRIKVGSGFYIRQLIDDISNQFDMPMLTYSIKRISVGKYTLQNRLFYNFLNKTKTFLNAFPFY